MAAVGAAPVLYQQQAGDACFFSSMSSYFSQSHGGVSSTSSSPASSFSAAHGASPPAAPAIAGDPAAQFNISEYPFDEGAFAALLPPVVTTTATATTAHTRSTAQSTEMMERPRTERIAFRTSSEVEILDDGYKWQKYGKNSRPRSENHGAPRRLGDTGATAAATHRPSPHLLLLSRRRRRTPPDKVHVADGGGGATSFAAAISYP